VEQLKRKEAIQKENNFNGKKKSYATSIPNCWALFHKYVHGAISRREFLDGAAKFAVGGLTATALWNMLRPNYAWASTSKPKTTSE
jgi:hypothetical protein